MITKKIQQKICIDPIGQRTFFVVRGVLLEVRVVEVEVGTNRVKDTSAEPKFPAKSTTSILRVYIPEVEISTRSEPFNLNPISILFRKTVRE